MPASPGIATDSSAASRIRPVGDRISLETLEGPREYVVDQIRIVSPNDVGVLSPTKDSTLTLVTCYPFYFVGDAPQRYIVRAQVRPDLSTVTASR
jgi:sortase A